MADAYVTMTSKKRFREARPVFIARESFVKGAGAEFDPKFANLMIKIIDQDSGDSMQQDSEVETELFCGCGVNMGPGLMAAYYIGKPITKTLDDERKLLQDLIEKNK